jgi:hypothetical protein
VSLLQPGIAGGDVSVTALKPFGVTGEVLDVKGRQSVSFMLGGREFLHSFLVCPLPTDAAGILSTDFLTESGATVDLECNKMTLADVSKTPRVSSEIFTDRTALTVFEKGKEGHSPRPSPRKHGARTSSSQPGLPARQALLRLELGLSEPKKISPLHLDAERW